MKQACCEVTEAHTLRGYREGGREGWREGGREGGMCGQGREER